MDGYKMSRKQRRQLIRIVVCLAAFAVLFAVDRVTDGWAAMIPGRYGWLLAFGLYLAVYLAIGYDVLWRAVRNIAHGQVFDENFLMCIATLGAFALAIYRGATGMEIEGFDEACAVLLFYQVGEWFQGYATGKSRKSISALMDIRPDSADVIRDGEVVTVDPSEVKVGEFILIDPGEKVPLDGTIAEGASSLDTKAKEFYDSTVAKILDLVENAAEQKSKAENFITKFARYYTPAVVAVALLLAVIPGAVTGEWSTWVYRALSFLVVSCPCALVISIPLTFFAGIGAASKHGILVKGSNYLERFDKANIFVFDKTGTLTKGNFAVTAVVPEGGREEILRLAASAEKDSTHPIARSIVAAYGKEPDGGYTLTDVAGEGIAATGEGGEILCGNAKLMRARGIAFDEVDAVGTVVYVAKDGVYKGALVIEDEVKPESAEVIGGLNALGCRTVMLTGDNARVADSVAAKLGVSDVKSSLLPGDKVGEVEKLLAAKGKGDELCFVGDGINDAPVLMRADIGIAMGGVGSDAAIEASDIVLMKDDLRGIPTAKRIARKTMAIVKQNIVFALAVKFLILILSAFGITNMWFAVFGDVGVAVLAILNAMRAGLDRT